MKKQIYESIITSGSWVLKRVFPEYFATEPLDPTDRYIEYPFILKNLPKLPCKILDVGCSGSMFPLIAEAIGYETYCIDIRNYSPSQKIFFTKSNICVAPYKSESFDVITAISSIEHIGLKGVYGQEEELDGDTLAIKEIYRILKPKGLFLMTVPYSSYLSITENHKIYNNARLDAILWRFKHEKIIIDSPESKDYKIALIKAIKE